MIYLHKILPVFVSPLFIVLVVLTIGLVKRRRDWLIAGVCLLFGISLPIVSEGLIWVRQHDYQRLSPTEVSSSEAIVVLGQGMSWVNTKNGMVPDWGDPDRFFAGVELILANKAPRLVFTGGKLPWDDSDQTEGDVLKQYAQKMQVPADTILVTSAFHMRRAKWLFENMGFEVLAYPVDVSGKSIDITWQSFLPNPWAIATVHSLVREGWGLLYYRLTYLISPPVVSNE